MIHVIENYYVDVDENCYIVCVKKRTQRNGEEADVFKNLHYFNNFKSAVKDIAKLYRRDKLSEKDMTLEDAIKALQTADNVLESVLYRAFGDS